MLKPHEITRCEEIIVELEELGLPMANSAGPFGRTLVAIEMFRFVSGRVDELGGTIVPEGDPAQRALALLAELICIYSLGIVRGDGEGITPW